MDILRRIGAFAHGHFALLCIVFLLLGVLVGEPVAKLSPAVPWLMSVLMFSSGLGLRLQDLHSLREKPWMLPVILVMLHGLIPLMSLGMSTFLGYPLDVVMGLALLAMIPVSATSLVWIAIHRGNVTLAMAFVLVDTILAPFIIPYALDFLFGADVHMDPFAMLRGLFWMLFFPTVLAITCNRVSCGALQRVAGAKLAFLAKLAVYGILIINGGIVSPLFHDFDMLFFLIFGTVFSYCAFWFVFTFAIGLLLFTDKEDVLAFMLVASIRGTNSGMVIATTYFSPLTTLTVVFNMLFQQPLGAWLGKHAARYLDKREERRKLKGSEQPPMPGES